MQSEIKQKTDARNVTREEASTAQIRPITGCAQDLELSVENWLDGAGITLLAEWDIWVFVYHHRTSLTSAAHIALLSGYKSKVVSIILERLEYEKLLVCSRAVEGVRLYETSASPDPKRQFCLQQLLRLSKSRAGRLLLARRLKHVPPEWEEKSD